MKLLLVASDEMEFRGVRRGDDRLRLVSNGAGAHRAAVADATLAWANLTGTAPRVPLDAVRMARKKMWVSNEKARRELGFSPGPAEEALARAVEWFGRTGRLSHVA